jgi:large subunit ribosomal protein L47
VPAKPTTKLQGDPDHGLWGFFRDKKLLREPEELYRHGRPWAVPELRKRTWQDLHNLWWVCVKERNRLATEKIVRDRKKTDYGHAEARERDETIQETMTAILDTLLERQKAYDEAYKLAKKDPRIDLKVTDGPQLLQEGPYDAEELDEREEEPQEEPRDDPPLEGKESPESNFYNSNENPPTLGEKVKQKTQKILWNK